LSIFLNATNRHRTESNKLNVANLPGDGDGTRNLSGELVRVSLASYTFSDTCFCLVLWFLRIFFNCFYFPLMKVTEYASRGEIFGKPTQLLIRACQYLLNKLFLTFN